MLHAIGSVFISTAWCEEVEEQPNAVTGELFPTTFAAGYATPDVVGGDTGKFVG
jgi:hypothetical protein